MGLSDLPTLAEVDALRRGKPIAKGETRRDHKLAKLAAAEKEDRAARAAAWARCGGKCERCHKRVKRDGGLLHGAEFNHVTLPRHGGRRVAAYEVTCHACHFSGPSGAHARTKRIK